MQEWLDHRPDFKPQDWEHAWARALARLNESQREVLAATSLLPDPAGFAKVASQGPAQWKAEGGNPTLQAVWALALRELHPAELPTLTLDEQAWNEPRVIAANVVLTGPVRWRVPLVFLGSVLSTLPLYDCGPDSSVTIVGRVTAPGLITSGDMQLLGDVDIPLIEGQGNDNMLIVLGDVSARVIQEADHACCWAGNVVARTHASLGDLPKEQRQKLEDAILPEFLAESRPRLAPAMEALAAGQDVFRGRPE
ncbi:hypothetical protein HUA78_17605 [Myxococcus sp. CA033]|uniref:hypothetical protein n=1 Tax=Myxococcus sp. CA033 TaxID=2741516 RepID=UPI00157B318D|nr:hypothetical protein [Myxococcus sp. CA033]NTX36257.1 hypothetical protein [Myxococcus sp. CA033]